MLLQKGMYADPNCDVLGLSYGQIRSVSVVRNAGWFNHLGEKIGSGDLSMQDMQSICNKMPSGESFFILSEIACLSMPSELDRLAPGLEFVLDNASWAISTADIFRLDDVSQGQTIEKREGISYVRFNRVAAKNHWMTNYVAPAATPAQNKSIVNKIEKSSYYGLDVYFLSDNSQWVVGTAEEAYQAALKAAQSSLWVIEPEIIAKFVDLSPEEKDSLKNMQDMSAMSCNGLIVRILNDQTLACCTYLVDQYGKSYYLDQVEHKECKSEHIPGLPSGYLAYRIDT